MVARIDSYFVPPLEHIPLKNTVNTVAAVAWRLSGGAGPGVTGLVSLQQWHLPFGYKNPTYGWLLHSLYIGCLITRLLGKCIRRWWPGGSLVSTNTRGYALLGVRETWRQCMTKCILEVYNQESKSLVRRTSCDEGWGWEFSSKYML